MQKRKSGAWIMEGELPLDFTDPRHIQHVVSTQPKAKNNAMDVGGDFELDDQGRMIIVDEEDEEEEGEKRRKHKPTNTSAGDDETARSSGKSMKRSRDAFESRDKPDKQKGKALQNKRQKGVHDGSSFKAKMGRGDNSRTGKVQPYAYLPLDPRNLNKRRQHQATGQFKGLVSAAKSGAAAGRKQRAKQKKRNNSGL